MPHLGIGVAWASLALWGSIVVPLLASIAQTGGATSIGWAEGSAIAMALGALAYIVRQLTSGQLVHRDLAASEKDKERMAALLEESHRREDEHTALMREITALVAVAKLNADKETP